MAQVFVKGEDFGYVADYLCEEPEDAIWRRTLSAIFWMGVKAGRATIDNAQIEIRDIREDW